MQTLVLLQDISLPNLSGHGNTCGCDRKFDEQDEEANLCASDEAEVPIIVLGDQDEVADMVFKKYIEQLSQLPELEEDCGHLLVGKAQQQLKINPELWAVTSGHLDSLPTLLIEPH